MHLVSLPVFWTINNIHYLSMRFPPCLRVKELLSCCGIHLFCLTLLPFLFLSHVYLVNQGSPFPFGQESSSFTKFYFLIAIDILSFPFFLGSITIGTTNHTVQIPPFLSLHSSGSPCFFLAAVASFFNLILCSHTEGLHLLTSV